MKPFYRKAILAAIVFAVSVSALSYPARHRGYYVDEDYHQLLAARNFALAGTYNTEDAHGIILASDQVSQKGTDTGLSNQLTPIIYGHLFKYLGVSVELSHTLAIALFSLFSVVVFLLVAHLFSIAIGFFAGLIMSAIPVVAVFSNFSATYEFAIVFFGCALFLFLGSRSGPFNASTKRVVLASIFFALAALARNAFALSFVPFFLFDLYRHRSWKRALAFLLPFLIIFGSTLTSLSYLNLSNGYTTKDAIPFVQLGHLFVDPYSFYYDSEAYIENVRETTGFNRIGVVFAQRLGYDTPLRDELMAYFESAQFYPTQLFSLVNIGGPLVIGLILLGMMELWRRNRDLLYFFLFWFATWYLFLVYERFANWDHFIEIIFPLIVLMSLGGYYLIQRVFANIPFSAARQAAIVIAVLLFVGHMGYASKESFSDTYRSSTADESLALASEIQKKLPVSSGTIATGIHANIANALAMLTNRSTIIFDENTLRKLLEQQKLKEAFDIYDVEAIAGYSEELSRDIAKETGVAVILLP